VRKANPAGIRDDFFRALHDIETTYKSVDDATLNKASKKLVAEYSLMAAAVLWEGYLSDLFVAYVNVDMTRFADRLLELVELSVGKSAHPELLAFAGQAVKCGHIKKHFTKKQLSLEELREVLDARGWNLTFDSIADLKKHAGLLLEEPHCGYFTTLAAPQAAMILAWRALRNFLAHRSPAAKGDMHSALRNPDLPSQLKIGERSVDDVGYHLTKALVGVPAARKTRLLYYLVEMRAIGRTLCPA
jgi:hypothetical protein